VITEIVWILWHGSPLARADKAPHILPPSGARFNRLVPLLSIRLSSSRREDLDIEARSTVRERSWLRQCGKTIGGDELVPVNENAGSLERIRPVVQRNREQPVRSFNVG
jgi:hypothetical protein